MTSPSEFTRLHEAMGVTLSAQLPRIKHIEAYPNDARSMSLPALFFALIGLRDAPDPGDGRQVVEGRFQACLLVDGARERASLQAAILASELARLLRGQYWGLEFVEEPTAIQAQADGALPELDQFAVWTVEWSQRVHLGDEEWPWPEEDQRLVFGLNLAGGDDASDTVVEPETLE